MCLVAAVYASAEENSIYATEEVAEEIEETSSAERSKISSAAAYKSKQTTQGWTARKQISYVRSKF